MTEGFADKADAAASTGKAGPARFTGKVGIITGAARGIGAAYARALASEGGAVAVADRDVEGARAVAAEINASGGSALAVEVDVASGESASAMADAVVEWAGGIDFLVNNAAIYGDMKIDSLLNVDWDYYRRFMSVNMDGALVCTRACWRHMARRGGGAIVNQSSTAAWVYSGFYGLAKVGVNGLTQQLAQELGFMKIRVNAIAPGPIDTEATRSVAPVEIVDDIVSRLAIKRRGTPDDLVGACLFLLADESSWITGQIFNVDGGQVIRS